MERDRSNEMPLFFGDPFGKAKVCATLPVSERRLIEVLTTPRLVRW
jgi:hypothetical protein